MTVKQTLTKAFQYTAVAVSLGFIAAITAGLIPANDDSKQAQATESATPPQSLKNIPVAAP